jgi:hypothetical protein
MGCLMGGNMLFSMDNDGNITHQFAGYFGARLLTQTWLGAPDGFHDLFPVTLRPKQSRGKSLLTAYVVYRPDGLWSFLIINKDSRRAYRVGVKLSNALTGRTMQLQSGVDLYQFSRENYELSAEGSNPYPIRSLPPTHRLLDKDSSKQLYCLPTH